MPENLSLQINIPSHFDFVELFCPKTLDEALRGKFQELKMDTSGTNLMIFSTAKSKQAELDLLDPRTDGYRESLRSSIAALEECRELISRLAIFSPNEEIEDVSSEDIKYDFSGLVLQNI